MNGKNRLTGRCIYLTTSLLLGATILTGCDFSSSGDLKRAERAIKDADAVHAETWAEPEYRKAQAAFVEAMDYAKIRAVNEARDKCAEAKTWADEAAELSRKRAAEMESEKDKLGTYKP